MIKNIQKNTVKQAETKNKKGFSRQEQYEHSPARKESFAARRRGKKKVTYKELGEIYPGRNGRSYKITLSTNTRNDKKSAIEDIYNNNMGVRTHGKYPIKRKTVKVFPTFTITSERITPFSEKLIDRPPKIAPRPPKNKFKSYIGPKKPFAQFTKLDWYLWKKDMDRLFGEHWATSIRKDKRRANPKPWDKYLT